MFSDQGYHLHKVLFSFPSEENPERKWWQKNQKRRRYHQSMLDDLILFLSSLLSFLFPLQNAIEFAYKYMSTRKCFRIYQFKIYVWMEWWIENKSNRSKMSNIPQLSSVYLSQLEICPVKKIMYKQFSKDL